MKLGKKGMKRFGAAAICAVLAAAICFSLTGGGAMAYTSLPNIEDIIANQQVFNILEIVPAEGSGSMGYYVGGSEPSVNALLQNGVGKGVRTTAATAYLQGLTQRGILGPGDDAPLKATGGYTEAAPWESHAGMTELKLTAAEAAVVKGAATQQTGGGYELVPVFVGSGGDYAQVVDYFIHGAQSGTWYYYNVTFSPLTYGEDMTAMDGKAIYANTANDGLNDSTQELDAAELTKEPTGTYYYVGTYPNASLDKTVTYYTGAPVGAPSNVWDAGHPYAAVGSGFTPATDGSGYFKLDHYKYVGEGKGNYSFVPAESGAEVTIEYASVWYSLGYTNNEWFKRYVFDRDNNYVSLGAITVKVTTKTADKVTVADVEGTGMVVLSAGLDVSTGDNLAGSYQAGMDLSAGVKDAVTAANTNKKPIVVDWALTALTADSRLKTLAVSLVGGSTDADHNFVNKNVLCFSPAFDINGTDGDQIKALATGKFNTSFSSAAISDGFSVVLAEIKNENFLRQKDGTVESTGLLPAYVTLSNSLRYIINYVSQRAMGGEKAEITVLELEPGTNAAQITEADVRGWLGNPTALKKITIVTMSTAEFAGKVDDLAENYDLIYVGGSTTGLNTLNGKTAYNDEEMNGLLYTNVGDLYRSDLRMAGLLDRDYTSATFNYGGASYKYINGTSGTQADLFRFSGNDLTRARASELITFAKAGYPVVIGDGLGTGATAMTGSYTLSVNVEVGEVSYGGIPLTATASLTPAMPAHPEFVYQWYQDGAALSTGTSITATEGHSYYCTVTMAGEYMSPASVTATSATYRIARDSAVVDNSDTSDSEGSYYGTVVQNKTLSVTVEQWKSQGWGGYYYLQATAKLDGATISGACYQWQRYNNNSWADISRRTQSSFSEKSYDKVRCKITYNDNNVTYTAYSDYAEVVSDWGTYYVIFGGTGVTAAVPVTDTQTVYYGFTAVGTASGNQVTLTAVPYSSNAALPAGKSYSYQWYLGSGYYWYPYGSTSTNASIVVDASSSGTDYYCCVVSVTPGNIKSAYTNYVTVRRGVGASRIDDPEPKTFTYNRPASITISTATVDSASQLYYALNSSKSYPNVMTVTQAKADSSTLYQYLNLSKPEIVWYNRGTETAPNYTGSYPTEYSMSSTGVMTGLTDADKNADGKYVITFRFKISNPTDATPVSTTYDCRLYMDLNSDGLYKSEERINDIIVHEMNDDGTAGGLLSPVYVENKPTYRLSAETWYEVTREMPENYVGIVPWKLQVVKTGAEGIHDSVHKYSHITPAANQVTPIKVLQITPSGGTGNVNLKDATYTKLLGDVKDFKVTIDQVRAGGVDNYGSTTQDILTELKKYDMLVIGFDDVYQALSPKAAEAIVSFIGTGKAVLFTHDTTSQANVPFSDYQKKVDRYYQGYWKDTELLGFDGGLYYWGYDFNTRLRDACKLDRYGITSKKTVGSGVTYQVNSVLKNQGDTTNLTNTQAADLERAGYTVAYTPKSVLTRNGDSTVSTAGAAIATVAETQGYTNYALIRYGKSGYKATAGSYATGRQTSYVSQLNEGQITTYPYDVNTTQYSKNSTVGNYLQVGDTHEQYYQLDLNSNDIVVWYCLSNGAGGNSKTDYYACLPNDAVNAYYIFSCGNVTYSGAGHSGTSGDEAKLFVNTLIAAFRTADVEPSLEFKTGADGATTTDNVFVTADYDESLSLSGTVSDTRVYFRITDTSLNKTDPMKLYLKYDALDSNGNVVSSGSATKLTQVFNPDGTAANGNYIGGLVYSFNLPQSVLEALSSENVSSVKLYLGVTRKEGVPAVYTPIAVRKIGLFPLS